MSTRSLLLWKKKLMLDLSILLTETKENLMALLCLKEKECEGKVFTKLVFYSLYVTCSEKTDHFQLFYLM